MAAPAKPPSKPPQAQTPGPRLDLGGEDVRSILADPDAYSRARRLGALLPTLGEDAVPAIAELMRDPSVPMGAIETELLVRFWATYDPQQASLWSFQAPLGYRVVAIVPAVELWAQADPLTAAQNARVASVDSGTANQAAQIAVVRGWFFSGQPGLVDYIRDLGEGIDQQRAISIFVREMIRRDGAEAAMAWAEGLPDEPKLLKLAAFRQVGSELAMQDLPKALHWCDVHCGGPFGDGVRKLIGTRWAAQDGPAAMEWLSKAPEGMERDLAVRVAFFTWSGKNQAEAFAWLAAHGVDHVEPWLRPAVVIYARLTSADSPSEALKWAALIPDDAERELTMVRIARRWRLQDEAAAEAWLEQSPLSEEDRQSARSPDPEDPGGRAMPQRG